MSDERKCDKCGDRMRVVSSHQYGPTQLRYLKCRKCGNQCRRAVAAEAVFRRSLR